MWKIFVIWIGPEEYNIGHIVLSTSICPIRYYFIETEISECCDTKKYQFIKI